ncbi:energy-coupling factor transporter transmembrane protein EcfT [Desulfuromonas versatilis]|uniref:Energy-coupling factor transporter transmembrane protein EcfT n=1 Tax=Desulfuromonas versatilis TaxID=2802975 RepID=A0ABN6DZ82_9BACT|nr:energy-coupling factor transporter transmembrane protein EcfT [Desulfuromonas versatilis]BCR05446.1 energy-coupling factor transporter transmembrane protein EcfT [Desulfuromonas versatilis]
MAFLADLTLGRYVPRDSPLHRLDPRLKLVGLPLFVIACFAGPSPVRLGGLSALALVLALLCRLEWRIWWRGLWVLRWLLLFSLLLHLFLSPGRTLFGFAWLSLDGLLRGLQVCWQLSLAVVFSSLLTLTTSPGHLAGGIASLLAPLQRFGLPAREWALLLGLVMQFIPILRDEALEVYRQQSGQPEEKPPLGLPARIRLFGGLVAPLMLRLVDRADALAQCMARGEAGLQGGAAIEALPRLPKGELFWFCASLAVLGALWMLG